MDLFAIMDKYKTAHNDTLVMHKCIIFVYIYINYINGINIDTNCLLCFFETKITR